MRRSIELTGLGHRKFYRAQNGLHHRLRLKFDAIPVSKARYEKLSAPAQKADRADHQPQHRADSVRAPAAGAPGARSGKSDQADLSLRAVHSGKRSRFRGRERRAAERGACRPRNVPTFGYDARSLDWWDYWINVHIPALRKWCYPLIEGRQPEAPPRRSVPLAEAASETPREPEAQHRRNVATQTPWPSS